MFAPLTISEHNRSIFPSNRSHKKKTCNFSGIFDDHNSQFVAIGIILRGKSKIIFVFVSFLLFIFICLNYKMFIVAKSKRTDERLSPTST